MIADTLINTYTKFGQDHPSIAALNDGGFVVCWESGGQEDFANSIYAQRFDANGAAQGNQGNRAKRGLKTETR